MSDDRCEKCGKATNYQGWKNYETWAVKLWIDNDRGLYELWRERTQAAWDDADDEEPLYASQTRSDRARVALAEELKDYFDTNGDVQAGMPKLRGLYADLMNAALSEVEWHDIADSMFDDIEGYEARA